MEKTIFLKEILKITTTHCFRSHYILKKNILIKRVVCINFHPGTPKYRGNYKSYDNK